VARHPTRATSLAETPLRDAWAPDSSQCCGDDAHGQNAHEFELMVEAGMPPMFAVQAATTHAAELLGREKDLPLDNIILTKHISFMMKGGTVYKRDGKPVELDGQR
jgi:imidazolonepropionase-like amidohydrolase